MTPIHQWNWKGGIRHLPTQWDLLALLELALGGLSLILHFGLFLVHLDLASHMALQHDLCRHAGKGLADITPYSQSSANLLQMSSNGQHIAPWLKTPGAKWFKPDAGGHIGASECITGVQPLQTHHGLCCNFFVKLVKVKVKALIWYSPILNLVSIGWCFATNPPAGNSPNLGVSHHLEVIQNSMQLTSLTGLAKVLSYPMFAGTHFTYPQRDGGLSQPLARLSQEWVLNLGLVTWQSAALPTVKPIIMGMVLL